MTCRLSTPIAVAAVLAWASCASAPRAAETPAPGSGAEAPATQAQAPSAGTHGLLSAGQDVEHAALTLEVDPSSRTVQGRVAYRLRPDDDGLAHLVLEGLEVHAVWDGSGRALEYDHDGRALVVELKADGASWVEFAVDYGGRPQGGLRFGEQHVLAEAAPDAAARWWPCPANGRDLLTSELTLTVPADWTTLALGERVGAWVLSDGRRRDHWRMHAPHPAAGATLVAGVFASDASSWRGVPLSFHTSDDLRSHVDAELIPGARAALELTQEWTGHRYPYPSLQVACLSEFPAEGRVSASVGHLPATAVRDARARRDAPARPAVVQHVARQWFGGSAGHERWIVDGLAGLIALLDAEQEGGVSERDLRLRELRSRWLDQEQGAVTEDDLAGAAGPLILHALRAELGDGVLRVALAELLAAGRCAPLDRVAAQAAFEAASGRELGAVFDQWLSSDRRPALEVRWSHDAERERLLLSVNQVHAFGDATPEAFALSAWVAFATESGVTRQRVTFDDRRNLIELVAPEAPRWLRFDSGRALPVSLLERKPLAEWLLILEEDEDVNGRLDGVEVLRLALLSGPGEAAQEPAEAGEAAAQRGALIDALQGRLFDSVGAVRVAAVEALAEIGAREALLDLADLAEADEDARVRVAALEALAALTGDGERDAHLSLARRVVDGAYSWGTVGAALRLAARLDPGRAVAWIDALPHGAALHGELEAEALSALLVANPADLTPRLVQLARDAQVGSVGRAAAASALATRLEEEQVPATLAGLCEDQDALVSRAAVRALATSRSSAARAILAAHGPHATDPRARQLIEASLRGQ